MSIDAVLFDLGNVLIRWDPRYHYRERFASADEMEAWLAEVTPGTWNHEMDRGKPFAQAITERSALYPQHAELLGEWKSQWERMLGDAIEDSVTLLADLRTAGYRVAALTNWSAETFPLARERYDFLALFGDIVVSGEVGVAKPDPAIFEVLRERVGRPLEECVFVDDGPKNVAAAAEAGLDAIHFTDTGHLREDLRARGLPI